MRTDVPVTENKIVDLSFQFSLKLIGYVETLEENRKFIIENQLLRSGTSIGSKIREARNSESKSDFIHKFKIAAKGAEETEYWLLLCKYSEKYPSRRGYFRKKSKRYKNHQQYYRPKANSSS